MIAEAYKDTASLVIIDFDFPIASKYPFNDTSAYRNGETGHLINGEVSNLKSLVITVDISTLKDSCRSVYKSRFTVQALISHF
jgi:hypothetical protein